MRAPSAPDANTMPERTIRPVEPVVVAVTSASGVVSPYWLYCVA